MVFNVLVGDPKSRMASSWLVELIGFWFDAADVSSSDVSCNNSLGPRNLKRRSELTGYRKEVKHSQRAIHIRKQYVVGERTDLVA